MTSFIGCTKHVFHFDRAKQNPDAIASRRPQTFSTERRSNPARTLKQVSTAGYNAAMLVDVPGSAPRICARCTSRLPAVLPIPETIAETKANMGLLPQLLWCRNEPTDPTPLAVTMNTSAPQRSPTLRTNVNCMLHRVGQYKPESQSEP